MTSVVDPCRGFPVGRRSPLAFAMKRKRSRDGDRTNQMSLANQSACVYYPDGRVAALFGPMEADALAALLGWTGVAAAPCGGDTVRLSDPHADPSAPQTVLVAAADFLGTEPPFPY